MIISETAHQLFDALDAHDLDAIAAFLHDDLQVSGSAMLLDKAQLLRLLSAYFNAFSDFDFNFTEATQDGALLRVLYAPTGTHDGRLDLNPLGIAAQVEPTYKSIALPPSAAELTFGPGGRITRWTLHEAEGATLEDLLALLGAEAGGQG
jgi:hypothetical protein